MTRIAFGPEAPEFASWEWIGADLCRALSQNYSTTTFCDDVPLCDVAVFIKFKTSADELTRLRQRCRLVYCPVDFYASASEIDGDSPSLECFDRIIVHAERLRKYFCTYGPVEYLDHHLKFVASPPTIQRNDGPFLWIGNRSNLPPVVEWVNQNYLPGPIWVLTDLPNDANQESPGNLGFRRHDVRIGRWTPDRHREWTTLSRAAFDIKGDDFRARHKPPTKAMDFLASGVPLAMNTDSSSSEHLRKHFEFEIASIDDTDHWLSAEYWASVQALSTRLRQTLSLDAVAAHFRAIIEPGRDGFG
jgi:hypothetical protein